MYEILSQVNHPHDLKGLTLAQLEQLAREIRQRIAEVVDKNGGHFGSNLGAVEITLALHRVFDFPRDRLVWDTSHQSYPHKLITGRRDRFHLIRTYGGICGFCNKKESIFDLFDAGHAGTACGLALGVAVADRLMGRDAKAIAVVGDAAVASGMSFEALNHAGEINENLIVVLNDNRMSIDYPVGALSKYLNRFRTRPIYRDLKRDVQKAVSSIPLFGQKVEETLERVHDAIKHTVVKDLLFQELGFNCFGPVDGHNLGELIELFENLRTIRGPVLVHAHTVKGHGYEPALDDPVKYHALKGFLKADREKHELRENGGAAPRAAADKTEAPAQEPAAKKRPTYSQVFQKTVHEIARKDRRLVAITAAMASGTGLSDFAVEFPDRYFDVGIAEQHGAAFASGLSYGGIRPIFAVYSTFCQRAYDQFVHDVCIQENPVIFCLDRAGVAGEDGWTHHGMFDIAYMRCIPNCVLMAPRDGEELVRMIHYAVDQTKSAVAIRYPKANVPDLPPSNDPVIKPGRAELLVEGEGVAIFAYGSMVEEAYRALPQLEKLGVRPTIVNARFAKPIDVDMLRRLESNHDVLVTLEEHSQRGGFGSAVLEELAQNDIRFAKVRIAGVPDHFVTFGSRQELLAECRLDVAGIVELVSGVVSSLRAEPSTELAGSAPAPGRLVAQSAGGPQAAGSRPGDRRDVRV